MSYSRPAIVTGDRADGTQQRLRYGLGEFKAYRYKGRPDWNPAKVLKKFTGKPLDRECGKCGAKPGKPCLSRAAKPMSSVHTTR